MTRALVTGADGFIGSHLCEALRDRGDEVTGLALYNSFDSFGWLDEVEGVQKVRGDVRDAAQMRELIAGHDLVFHLAALISVPYSYQAPQSFIDTNVTGTLNVLEACRAADAKLVHTSTSEVYGSAQYTPMDEQHPICPQSPYAASKVAADALVRSYNLSFGLPCVILRPFNTYGPRQSERAVVATIIRQALDPACHAIKLGKLNAFRDLTYVGDMVRAFIAVSEINEFDVFNAGTGDGLVIVDLARVICDAIQSFLLRRGQALCREPGDKPVLSENVRLRPEASEVIRLQADAHRLTAATGWKPRRPMNKGLDPTIAWWRTRDFRPSLADVA